MRVLTIILKEFFTTNLKKKRLIYVDGVYYLNALFLFRILIYVNS